MARTLRFVMLGAGFWAQYQLSGWYEHPGVECVGIYNRSRDKAERLASRFHVPAVYDTPEDLLDAAGADFADIVTAPGTHRAMVELCADRGIPVVCQKPMAESLADAEAMVAHCDRKGVPLLINENWRWQTPIREAGKLLRAGRIGRPFRARISFVCSFPVFDNQPFLKELGQFILTDIGSHILDTARFLFGEATSVTCLTRRINPDIQGEDVATVLMPMVLPDGGDPVSVVCEMSYASRTEYERFPETYLFVEGTTGSLELGPDFRLRVTDGRGTHIWRVPPPRYSWADPAYDLVHSSIVPCHGDLLRHLRGKGEAETVGASNLKTMRLVFKSYESAATGRTVAL